MGSRARPPCSSWKVSGQAGVAVAHHGDTDPGGNHAGEAPSVTWTCPLAATVWGPSLWLMSAQTWPYPTAFPHQHLDASGQTTEQGGGSAPSTRQTGFVDSLRPEPSPDTPLDMARFPRSRCQDPAPSARAKPQPCPPKPCTGTRPASNISGQTPDTRKPRSHSPPTGQRLPGAAGQHKLLHSLIPNCVRSSPRTASDLTPALGSLGPRARTSECSSASNVAPTPEQSGPRSGS